MLKSLLMLSKDERKGILKKLKPETKKLIFDNIYTMTEELGLNKITDYEIRIKMRAELIEKFPDTVFWDYGEIANSALNRKCEVDDFERFMNCKISTNGDIVVQGKGARLSIFTNSTVYKSYLVIDLGRDKKKVLHRMIASLFIPKPERLKEYHYKNLEVNHVDGTYWNNKVSNLEWVTFKENIRHGLGYEKYNDKKYFQFEVMADNGFLGTKFILSEDDLHLLGLNFSNLRKRAGASKYNFVNKLRVTMLEEEDVEGKNIGIPNEILELYRKDIRYFNPDIVPVIGTVLDGKHKGFQFSFFGRNDANQYFHGPEVNAAARGDSPTYKICAFRQTTHKEAIPLHNKLTKEIIDDINNANKWFLLELMVDNGFKGRKFVIHIEQTPIELDADSIRDASRIEGKFHYGFSVTSIEYSDIHQYEKGFPEDIRKLFNKNKRYFDADIKPVIGTILEGEYQGLKFSLFGKTESETYFNQSRVCSVATGKGETHYGCSFRYVTHKEAIPLHGNLTDEIVEYIEYNYNPINLKKYFLFEVVVDNGFKGRKFVLNKDNLPAEFIYETIDIVTNSTGCKTYKGFKVSVHRYLEIAHIRQGFPNDIRELFNKDQRYFHTKTKPVIGTVITGPFKGFEFSFLSMDESNEYFNADKVSLIARGKLDQHNGCSFRYSTIKEAIPLLNKLTKEIAKDTVTFIKKEKYK